MLFKVNIKGVVISVHAKNEGQLAYAVTAIEESIGKNPKLLVKYKEEEVA